VEARDALNRALHHPSASRAQQQAARAQIAQINDLLVFSPRVVPGDPLARTYEIQGGDILSRIARDESIRTDWRLLLRLNNIADARRIRVGQKIKLLQGPFHAEIFKSTYRIDFYADTQDSSGNRLYICSRPCGLGEYDSTPVGGFKVRSASKLVNPHWVNPRTGERFDADDPNNPIGERWIGLEGTDEGTSGLLGYGIHGTIDPGSIGGQESMGCVRLLPDDVALAYELLVVERSTVEVLP
jgi:LysM repeat protein